MTSTKEQMLAIHNKWIADLRSGKYLQGRHTLVTRRDHSDENHYCCLGVLACTNDYDSTLLEEHNVTSSRPFGKKAAHDYHELLRNNDLVKLLPMLNDGVFRSFQFYNQFNYEDMRVKEVKDITFDNYEHTNHSYEQHTFEEIADFLEKNTDIIFNNYENI